jgi:Bacterial Ig-like domain
MRATLLRSLAVIGVGAVVLAGVLYVATTFDARPPTVLEVRLTAPSADDDRVALITTSLEVVFSEPIATGGAAEAVAIEPVVPGAVSWSGSTMIFTPADPLELETEYVVTVDEGIEDLSGNPMTELPPPFEFVTAGRPSLVESEPGDGAEDVPLDAPIALTFSTLMDTASVEEQLRLSPSFDHELRWSGELLEIVPAEPLEPDNDYEVTIGADAADVAGVSLGDTIALAFHTIAPGFAAETLVPADGIDGIAQTTPIAVIFDQPIDPDSIDPDQLTITPAVAGTLEVTARADDPPDEDGAGRVLRFTPSGPLPPNTTFEVELAAELTTTTGEALAEPLRWSFTTAAPIGSISNGIAFVTDRGGIANVWVMNADGTGQRQVSAELEPVLEYAVAPDGSSLVVADGRRLTYQRADGSDRRVLTDAAHLEFDPTYAPDGQVVAFARADVETGAGLGLWEWQVGGGDATQIVLPDSDDADPTPSPSGTGAGEPLRAPRYAPDGQALAFVDLRGRLGILELPGERLTLAPFAAAATPIWKPDSTGVMLTGSRSTGSLEPEPFSGPIAPLTSDGQDAVYRLARSGTDVGTSDFGLGSRVLAVAFDGLVAWTEADGSLSVGTDDGDGEVLLEGVGVVAAAFAPGELTLAIVADAGSLEHYAFETEERTLLAPDGAQPSWLP